ncbi:hypothetical protein [Rheinheimera sp. 4Y26]|uniref:hypothetical protein n=1 Tax=Rheinheimera sp. 4Y26 TaxID=2977811 RepID=UPI0021B116BB|nr:hypothetical protein [Rheinheimera sp. 4Y26]MCT6699967.1 hypothetical protein [Rheinheimera sp. 4Y26]
MNIDIFELEECRAEIQKITERNDLDVYSLRALLVIKDRLSEIAERLNSEPNKTHGVIARLVVEQNPSVLSPELGRKLIEIEKSLGTRNA